MTVFGFFRRLSSCLPRIACAAALSLPLLLPAAGAAQQPTVADLKAAYIYNFVRYVEWPAEAEHRKGADFMLCLAGPEDEALFAALYELDGKSVRDHRILVRRSSADDELRDCAMMVIEKADADQTERLLQQLEGSPTLTVSSTDGFLDHGGMIRLVTEAGKVRFDINLGAARRNDLILTFQLLKLARTVKQP